MRTTLKVSLVLALLMAYFCVSPIVALADDEEMKSKFNVKMYGYVKFESFWDNTEIKQGDWLLYAFPDGSAQSERSVFSMNARHTRFGFRINGPDLTPDIHVRGLIEADFAGGFPNSTTAARQPILRLRHAWVELQHERWELRMGQDWALFCGPFPNTTNFVVGAGTGNLWMRYSQMRFTYKMDPFKFAISANRPMAGNQKYEDYLGGDFDPVFDGETTGLPWVMGRIYYDVGNTDITVSGHYGQERVNDILGNDHWVTTYSVQGDVVLPVSPFTFTVRGFYGTNLNSFFGGAFQGVVADTFEVNEVASMGGWAQAVFALNPQWDLTAGYGFDDPDDEYLTSGRDKNEWMWGNVAYKPHPSVKMMLEGDYLKTTWIGQDDGENIRIMFASFFFF